MTRTHTYPGRAGLALPWQAASEPQPGFVGQERYKGAVRCRSGRSAGAPSWS